MPRSGARRRTVSSEQTRRKLVDATVRLLSTRGFSATTARAIGEEAGCNQGLVFYHFGSLNDLLLAALDASSEQRLARYRDVLAQTTNLKQLRAAAGRLYREDRDAGHVTLLAELVAGGLVDRDLGRAVATRVQPWVELVEQALTRTLPAPVRRRLPVAHLADGIVALYLGLEILGQLAGDHSRSDAVLEQLAKAQPVAMQ